MPADPGNGRAGPDDPDEGGSEPADRTRLAWTRTAIAFAAIGGAMLRSSPAGGAIVVALSVPVWAAVRGTGRAGGGASRLQSPARDGYRRAGSGGRVHYRADRSSARQH